MLARCLGVVNVPNSAPWVQEGKGVGSGTG
jgi:hypothetical protein